MGGGPFLSFYRWALALAPGCAPIRKGQTAAIFTELLIQLGLTDLEVSPDGAAAEHVRRHGPGAAVCLQAIQPLARERTGGGSVHESLSQETGTIRRGADIGAVCAPQRSLAWTGPETGRAPARS